MTCLPFCVEHLQAEGLGVLAAELEHVAHLDAARGLQGPGLAHRAGVAVADLGGLDRAVAALLARRGEVAAGDQVEDVVAAAVRAGEPRAADDDAGVEQVADAGAARAAQRAGADVALGQAGVRREVGLGERLDLGGLDRRLEALGVDLAVARARRRRRARACRRGGGARRGRSSGCRRPARAGRPGGTRRWRGRRGSGWSGCPGCPRRGRRAARRAADARRARAW